MIYQKSNSKTSQYFECIRYKDFSFFEHMHRNPELIYVRKGEISVITELGKERVTEGNFALVFPNRVHSYSSEGSSVVDVLIFSEDHVPNFSSKIRGKSPDRCVFSAREEVRRFVESSLFVCESIPDFYILKGALYAILGEFLLSVSMSESAVKKESLIDEIIAYVDKNYTEPISLKSMAEALGYESHYLSRYFHQRIPMHFSRYVNLYRVERATNLLMNTDMSITEIALSSGFQSIRSFNRVYLELTGLSPSMMSRGMGEPPSHLVTEPPRDAF